MGSLGSGAQQLRLLGWKVSRTPRPVQLTERPCPDPSLMMSSDSGLKGSGKLVIKADSLLSSFSTASGQGSLRETRGRV